MKRFCATHGVEYEEGDTCISCSSPPPIFKNPLDQLREIFVWEFAKPGLSEQESANILAQYIEAYDRLLHRQESIQNLNKNGAKRPINKGNT